MISVSTNHVSQVKHTYISLLNVCPPALNKTAEVFYVFFFFEITGLIVRIQHRATFIRGSDRLGRYPLVVSGSPNGILMIVSISIYYTAN
jgi:hypothetical protein